MTYTLRGRSYCQHFSNSIPGEAVKGVHTTKKYFLGRGVQKKRTFYASENVENYVHLYFLQVKKTFDDGLKKAEKAVEDTELPGTLDVESVRYHLQS